MLKYLEKDGISGKGLKHWLSLRLMFTKRGIWDEKDYIGDEIKVRILKTRFDIVRQHALMFNYPNKGFDIIREVLTMADDWKVLYKETPRARKLFWLGYESKFGGKTIDEWYNAFSKSPNALKKISMDISKVYEEYYNRSIDDDIDDDIDDQEYDEENDDWED